MIRGNIVRWGILGAANIARKNWKAIRESGNSIVSGVASRTLERSQSFIAECQQEAPMPQPPRPFASYEELLDSKEIDAVYIPLPTGIRKEWVLRAANAKKHVLCEKPCAVTVTDLEEMLAACKRNNVQFMDGVMFMHSKRLERTRELLKDPAGIGGLKRITSAFSFRASPNDLAANIRGDARLEPHGCVGDLGWYCIRLALWAADFMMPQEVSGRILAHTDASGGTPGVITDFSGELIFPNGASSSFYCSFVAENQQWAIISGDHSYLQMDDFVLPIVGKEVAANVCRFEFKVKGCDFRMESHSRTIHVPEHSHGHPDAQETNMIRNFSAQVLSGRLNDRWPEMALKTQQVMAQCIEHARGAARHHLRPR